MYFCGKFYSLCKARRVNVEGSPFGLRRAKGSVKSKENTTKIKGKVLKKAKGSVSKIKECHFVTEISQIFSNLSIIFRYYLFDLFRFERFGYAELKVLAVGDSK